jgi:hypothetical protein
VHLIGHSHGGNVVNEAADLLRWGRSSRKSRIASLTTVGTPFFRTQLGAFGSFGGVAFAALTGLLLLYTLGLAILGVVFWNDPDFSEDKAALLALAAYLGFSALVLVIMVRLAIQWTRRVLRPRTLTRSSSEVHAISHPNDEAITFLKKVEAFPVEPFTRGALLRNSRALAISWSVWSIIFAGLAITAALLPQTRDLAESFDIPPVTLDAAAISVALLPILWGAVYLVARLVFGVFPGLVLRRWFNSTVGAIIRGMAFGRDSDDRLGGVSAA